MKFQGNYKGDIKALLIVLSALASGCASVSPVPAELQAIYAPEPGETRNSGAISVSELLQRARHTSQIPQQEIPRDLALQFEPGRSELSASLHTRIQSFFDQQPVQRGWNLTCAPEAVEDRFSAIQVATSRCRAVSRLMKTRHIPVRARLDTRAEPGSVLITEGEPSL